MDGASAIISFVAIALQSAKAIHRTLSAVKDGPHNLQNVIHSVQELKNILERLESILRSGVNNADADLTAFSELAGRCVVDMTRFDESIKTLSISSNTKKIRRFWKKLKTALDEKELDRMRSILQGHTSSIALRIITFQSAQTSASASQISRIHDIVETLGDRLSHLNYQDSGQASLPSNDVEMPTTAQDTSAFDTGIEDSISRLCDLVDVEGHTRDADDAEQLIEDLKNLLDTAYHLESQHTDTSVTSERSNGAQNQPDPNLSNELKLASNLVSTAQFISVNSQEQAKHFTFNPLGTITDQQRKRKFIELGGGTLTITTNKRFRRLRTHRNQDQMVHSESYVSGKEFLVRILFRPQNSSRMLTIYLDQSAMLRATLSTIPRLCVNNIVPWDAPIFEIARCGRVEDLNQLIAAGRASLRDRDPRGWSPLHYAVRNFPMCKYLIQNGLDVDEIVGQNDSFETTPLHESVNYSNTETAALLLEAGVDPTVSLPGARSIFDRVNTGRTTLDEKIFVDITSKSFHFIEGFHFGLVDPRDEYRNSIFLQYLILSSKTEFSQKLKSTLTLFLQRECSIRDANDEGDTCLHLYFAHCGPLPSYQYLKFLFEQGADPRATNGAGVSVAEVVYILSATGRNCHGSRTEDLFDACLQLQGYDLGEFRTMFLRMAYYTDSYTRQDFERLWEGAEDQCPYWDDKAWPLELYDSVMDFYLISTDSGPNFELGYKNAADYDMNFHIKSDGEGRKWAFGLYINIGKTSRQGALGVSEGAEECCEESSGSGERENDYSCKVKLHYRVIPL